MTPLSDSAFTGGDPSSRLLVDLCADRWTGEDFEVNASFIELAQRHGLIPILARRTNHPLVRAIRIREAARRTVLEAHLAEILGYLDGAGVRAAVVKGPAVAARYSDPSLRPFSDIDLLVRAEQAEMALEKLTDYPATVRVPPKRPKADKRDILIRDPSGVTFNVDLHWDLFSYSQLRESAAGATEAAWRGAEKTSTLYGDAWDLPDSFRLAFLASHAILDHRFRLILFRDLLELCREPIDWDELERVVGMWGLRSTTYISLWIAQAALDAPVPAEALAAIRPRSLPVAYLRRALPRTDIVRFDGHRSHPINLASVLLNDSASHRLSLLMRGPSAFWRWRQRAGAAPRISSPRVLILVSTDRRRGAEVFTERLRDGLLARGWLTDAVSLKGYREEPRTDLDTLVDASSVTARRFEPAILRQLKAKVRSFRPDVVIANGGATLRYAVAGNVPKRYKLIYIGIGEPKYWLRSHLSRWISRMMLRRVDSAVAVSSASRDQLEQLEPTLRDRLSVIYTTVPDHFLGLPLGDWNGPLRVLMVGSLTPEKNLSQGVRVIARVREAHARVIGDGPLRAGLESEARGLGIEERITFVGSVADVTPHLQWAHVLVLTSRSEGLPGAILEAAAAGVPAVAVDVGGVREAIDDGVSGLVTADSDDELVEALTLLDADRGLLAKMGQAARNHVRVAFDARSVMQSYIDTLSRVVG